MSLVAQSFGPVAPGASEAVPALVAMLTTGAVGMSIRQMIDIFGDGGDGDGEDESMADGGLMADEGDEDDDLGGFGGLDDEGDDFGEFDDDGFGDMDEGGSDTDELEHRLDELETEVGSLSSTVNTVRNENEQIAETVDDVEENVRKLLDIYEMVTRGVNPFADDMEAGGMGGAGGGGGNFGLFDDDGDDESEEDLDDDIANADAEGFFDEDLVEDDDSPEGSVDDVMGGDMDDDLGGFEDDGGTFDEGSLDEGDDLDDFDDFDDEADDLDGDSEDMSESTGDGEGGKSFAELKDEYESGDAEWADELEEGDDALEDDLGDADELLDADDSADGSDGDLADDDLFDEVIEEEGDDGLGGEDDAIETEPEPEPESEPEPEPEPTATQTDTASTTDTGAESAATESTATGTAEPSGADDADDGGKPYLTTMPEGLASELVVVEWLEYLVEQVGVREAARAIDYYETIDWVSEPVAEDLQTYLRGFDGSGGEGGLTIDHHTESLRYISQLDGDAAEAVALSKLSGRRGGGADGLQR